MEKYGYESSRDSSKSYNISTNDISEMVQFSWIFQFLLNWVKDKLKFNWEQNQLFRRRDQNSIDFYNEFNGYLENS